ncbi:hypothetical protein ATCVGM07011_885L [Acanthocystis turfacea Chlorella virus GM0701.1]|nr:hypothetical protein ATCVGM07011_885L [Acanthocystis turfacea Chlorella virus GM0701.1]
MKTLEYYSTKGNHNVFPDFAIDADGVVKNIKTGTVLTCHKNPNGYNAVSVIEDNGTRRRIYVARALASTFMGKPPSAHHTADHIDRNRLNDTIKNICWASKSEQANNRKTPTEIVSACRITRNGVEHSANGWTKVFTKPNGEKYTTDDIRYYAQQHQHGFMYKTFPNLPREVWKPVKDSKNKKGEWFISSKNRMKYKTSRFENVLTADQLSKRNGYPIVNINNKQWNCHELSMMAFRPREYAAKLPGDIILHKNDDKLDFNPFHLRLGVSSENVTDAHNNGRYNGTKSARKHVVSYINDEFEKEHPSLRAAAIYLRENGYPLANSQNVWIAKRDGIIRYNRTWKVMT